MNQIDKRPESFALGRFHFLVSEGDLSRVQEFITGKSSKTGAPHPSVSCNAQDQDGFSAVHWAAIKGQLEIMKYLLEGAPEISRGNPSLPDNNGWTPIMWAIHVVETSGKDYGKRRKACEVINYLVTFPAVKSHMRVPDKLLLRNPQELALEAARQTDQGILAAMKNQFDGHKFYAPLKEADDASEGGGHQDDDAM
mmetsp:Transcript_68049/g.181845  ORF Transcript_68049/g.181845 Transcript_68049/m.181845 type:complete len:196 (+) Transcript_68049:2-589(+)